MQTCWELAPNPGSVSETCLQTQTGQFRPTSSKIPRLASRLKPRRDFISIVASTKGRGDSVAEYVMDGTVVTPWNQNIYHQKAL